MGEVEFYGSDNYVVSEYTTDFVRINDIVYNLTKKTNNFFSERSIDADTKFMPNSIHNISKNLICAHTDSLFNYTYCHNNNTRVFIDIHTNLVICENNKCTIIKKHVRCKKILFSYGLLTCGVFKLKLILIYDEKIVYASYTR